MLLVIAVPLLYTPFTGVYNSVTGPVDVSALTVVAARLVVPATLRLPVIVSFPETALLAMLVAASVVTPLTFSVPGVVNVLMLLVNCESCAVKLA